MKKSSQYNQQSKSEVEEIFIYHPKHGKWPSQHLHPENKYLVGSMPERIPSIII